MNDFERLRDAFPALSIQQRVRMDQYTTLRVGGPADMMAETQDEAQLCALLRAAKELGIPAMILGNGSNLLVRDGGIRGLVVRQWRSFSLDSGGIWAQAGALLSVLARAAQEKGLTGLEFAQGIPGTVGGGVYMNAGAYGGELGALIESVRVLDGDTIREIPGKDMNFSYRHSRAMEEGWIILGASIRLKKGDPEQIAAAMRDYAARRREKQPLEYPSAGSFFKRPAGHYAGALIEQAGLKGYRFGGAQVSEKHAGFLINAGGATASDFLKLMEIVQQTVEEKFQVWLEPEVRIVGSDE